MSKIAPMITGLYETHLPVANLDRAKSFYGGTLGLELAREFPQRSVAFYWIGGREQGMLGLWQSGSGPLRMVLHLAFRMTLPSVMSLCNTLEVAGVSPLGFSGEAVTEPVVLGWMPAASVYCNDPDGHSIEFLAMMDDAPDAGFGTGPLSMWNSR